MLTSSTAGQEERRRVRLPVIGRPGGPTTGTLLEASLCAARAPLSPEPTRDSRHLKHLPGAGERLRVQQHPAGRQPQPRSSAAFSQRLRFATRVRRCSRLARQPSPPAGLLLLRLAVALGGGVVGARQPLPGLAADRHPQRLDLKVGAVAAACRQAQRQACGGQSCEGLFLCRPLQAGRWCGVSQPAPPPA